MKISKKYDKDLIQQLLKNVTLDKTTGQFSSPDHYMSLAVNIGWKGGIVSVPASHLSWLLTHGRWPEKDKVIDHIDDDAFNNRPDNLQEITYKENQLKRRNRKVYRNYGTGKYGHGFGIYYDKRDGRYYVNRNYSRAHTGARKTIKQSFGGHFTLEEAEAKIEYLIKQISNPTDLDDLLG